MHNPLFEKTGSLIVPVCYSSRDAAKVISVSPSTLERLRRKGEIACVKISERKIAYRREELDRFAREKEERAG